MKLVSYYYNDSAYFFIKKATRLSDGSPYMGKYFLSGFGKRRWITMHKGSTKKRPRKNLGKLRTNSKEAFIAPKKGFRLSRKLPKIGYASLLIEQGENIKYIQSQLGHSSPIVTLNVDALLMKPVNQEAALRLENSVFGQTGHNLVATNKKGVTVSTVTP